MENMEINIKRNAAHKLNLLVNLDKSKIIILRNGGHVAAREKRVGLYYYANFTIYMVSLSDDYSCAIVASHPPPLPPHPPPTTTTTHTE